MEDFVTDAHFKKWILEGGTVEEFGQHFLVDYPNQRDELIAAAKLLNLLQFKNTPSDTESMEVVLQQTLKQIDNKKSSKTHSWLKYAAVLALFIFISSLAYYFGGFGEITYMTNFGEKQKVVLPDGSEVVLNANSSISYSKDWEDVGLREVTLKGEAYFEVTHQKEDVKFVVHTDAFDVEVIGTSFNLISRPNKQQVMLKEGKVEVHLLEVSPDIVSFLDSTEIHQIQQSKTLQLSPNQVFETRQKQSFIHKEVSPNAYTAWLSNKFICDQTPLSDLVSFIENQYGWEVTIKDDSLLQKEINGTIPTNNIEVVLEALPLIMEVEVIVDKTQKEIILSSNPS
ncbi:MAG: FecR family protein [Chitinophagales bacterium]